MTNARIRTCSYRDRSAAASSRAAQRDVGADRASDDDRTERDPDPGVSRVGGGCGLGFGLRSRLRRLREPDWRVGAGGGGSRAPGPSSMGGTTTTGRTGSAAARGAGTPGRAGDAVERTGAVVATGEVGRVSAAILASMSTRFGAAGTASRNAR